MKRTRTLLVASMLLLGGQAFAIDVKDGVYQIATAQDLVDFSQSIVASGNHTANAVMTEDIDMTGVEFSPIGSMDSKYAGHFDGQCHYVRNLTISTPDKDKVGLFGVVANGAYIANVILDANSSISGNAFVGGIVGSTDGSGSITLENVGNEANVSAEGANAAGLVGVSMGGNCAIHLVNCFNTGRVYGGRESASFCGWLGGGSVVENCYSYATVIGRDGSQQLYRNSATVKGTLFDNTGQQGVVIDEEELYNGAFTYKLNGMQSESPIWYQSLNDGSFDEHPVPFKNHPVVYANGSLNCDGTAKPGSHIVYANTNASLRDSHQFVEGICSVCGALDEHYLTKNANGYYEIGNAGQLYWFAKKVNAGDNSLNGLLTADIDYTSKDLGIAMSRNFPYRGVFDGQGHRVTINFSTYTDNTALFGFTSNATIKNLLVDGNIETTGKFAGGLFSVSTNGGLVENVVSAVNIKCSAEGDVTMGGIASNTANNLRMDNVAFVGSIDAPKAEGSAGLIGYAHGGEEILISNSFVAARLNMAKGSFVNRKAVVLDNCYYITMDSQFDNQDAAADSRATQLTDAFVLSSGKLCYLLNKENGGDIWYQTLAEDAFPVPFATSKKVYLAGNVACDGKPTNQTNYSNEEGQLVRASHDLNVNGECRVCGNRVLSNANQLVALRNDCEAELLPENVVVELANDIDMAGVVNYIGIGTRSVPFKGTFDGKGHSIKNLTIDTEKGNVGLFSHVTGGTTIKNVVVEGDIYAERGWAGGIIGVIINNGGLVALENVGNEAAVTTDGPNAAGIIGVAEGCLITMSNVYNAGTITGGKESAAISGWLTKNAVLNNVYNCGAITPSGVDGTNTFARCAGTATFNNCYETGGSQVTTVDAQQVTNGELCYLLNGAVDNGTNFYQNLDEDAHPVILSSHKTVYKDGEHYANGSATSIATAVAHPNKNLEGVYTLTGIKMGKMQKGINIVKMSDGTIKKIFIK